jgi:hypothetical protein
VKLFSSNMAFNQWFDRLLSRGVSPARSHVVSVNDIRFSPIGVGDSSGSSWLIMLVQHM